MGILYKITNLVNGKVYIGKTNLSLEERLKAHIYTSIHSDTYLYRAIRRYGKDKFNIEIIEECSDELLDEREIFHIKNHGSLVPIGYNMTKGGTGGDTTKKSEHHKNWIEYVKTSGYFKGANNPMYGVKRVISPEHLEKLQNGARTKNRKQVYCDGMVFNSINEAQEYFVGISVKRRLNSEKWPNWYRIKERDIKCKN